MKKQRIVCMLAVLLLCGNCLAACTSHLRNDGVSKTKEGKSVCEDWIHPDSVAYQTLGKRLTDVLINAKSVKVYSLVFKEAINSDDYEVEPHFIRDSLLGSLTKDQAVVLKYMLVSNGANYHKDSTFIVMSPYYPVIEFEFIKKKEVAHVIISLSNYTWTVKFDDKIQFKYNYASGTFIKRFCDYFLKDDNKK